jgi:predicted anti-sigma-YlaC factor YlaD
VAIVEISCAEVRRELCNYIDDDVSAQLRKRIERHIAQCHGCRALFDGINNVLQLVASGEVFQLPPGFSRRLRERIETACDPF